MASILEIDTDSLLSKIDNGKIDINGYYKLHKYGDMTLLIAASMRGNLKLSQALLDRNASVDLEDDAGQTALINAVIYSRNSGIVELLLKNNADPNHIPRNKNYCLRLRNLDTDLVKSLLDHGADPQIDRSWPIYNAVFENDLATLKLFLEYTKNPGKSLQDVQERLNERRIYVSNESMEHLIEKAGS